MIAVDTNVLVHAHRQDSPFYAAALGAIQQLAEGRGAWALPWPCLHEFVAIVTHARIWAPPSTAAQAVAQVDAWLESPSVQLLAEGPTHWPHLRELLITAKVSGGLTHDARIAALCLQHGVRELWTADRDFSRFAGLKLKNPLL